MREAKKLRVCVLGLCALGCILWPCSIWKRADSQLSPNGGGINAPNRTFTKEEATELVCRIHENMTFAEISRILPLSTNDTHYLEHGGISYIVPLGDFNVRLRFKYPGGSYETNAASPDSVLNLAPLLQ